MEKKKKKKNVIVSFIFWLSYFDMRTRYLTFGRIGRKCFYLKIFGGT